MRAVATPGAPKVDEDADAAAVVSVEGDAGKTAAGFFPGNEICSAPSPSEIVLLTGKSQSQTEIKAAANMRLNVLKGQHVHRMATNCTAS